MKYAYVYLHVFHQIYSSINIHGFHEIAEGFSTFYEPLYSSSLDFSMVSAPFVMEELAAALAKMKAGKAKDTCGIAAKMLKHGGETLRSETLELFFEILVNKACPPAVWKKSRLNGSNHLSKKAIRNCRTIIDPSQYSKCYTSCCFAIGFKMQYFVRSLQTKLHIDQDVRQKIITVAHFALQTYSGVQPGSVDRTG